MARIFISYSRADRVFLDGFVPLIRKVYGNDSLWFDGDIHGGADWWQMILDEVGKCELFIYLVSNESLESPYCQAELREALRLNKQILPVTVRRLKPAYPGNIDADLAEVLRRTQYIDFSGGFNDSTTAASLYGAINRLFEAAPSQQSAPKASEPIAQPPVPDRKRAPAIYAWPRIGLLAAAAAAMVIVALVFVLLQDDESPDRTLQVTPGPTLLPEEQLAMTRVTRNNDWSPVERTFNGATMMLVPAGCFDMGTEDGGEDDQPVNEVCFDVPFWIDKYEVTNDQYESIGCEDYSSSPEHPRNCVSWFGARDFCARRDARLPSEAEWEYAARGPDGLMYPFDATINNALAVYAPDSGDHPGNVGERPFGASWVGAEDLSGNMTEWTSSLFMPYPYAAADGREADTGDDTGVERVVRGGSFSDTENDLRAALRTPYAPDESLYFVGFRCARDAGQ